MLFMALMSWVVVKLPPAEGWPDQKAYEAVFGSTWRIVFASVAAFWAGEFANSFVLAKMKLLTQGRHLWMRTIGSTVVGQGRSEEHTSELQSLMRTSYAVFCLKKKKK